MRPSVFRRSWGAVVRMRASRPAAEDGGTMKKILVIDDDASVRDTIVQILEGEGYAVISAEDGKRGFALFRSEHPDLVITDIIMPEREGIQTITDIRGVSPKAKVIAISGGTGATVQILR